MPRGDRSDVRGTLALVLVLALVGGGVLAWRTDVLDRFLDGAPAAAPAGPESVPPPPGLELPKVREPGTVARPSAPTRSLDAAAVRRALAPYLADKDLGPHVLAAVAPLDGGRPVFTRGGGAAIPASTTKLFTTAAAMLALGPDHVFTTSVVATPPRKGVARVVLVGGGDPFLERTPRAPDGSAWPYPARADLTTLAKRTARGLKQAGTRRVRLSYDTSLFSGPSVNPTWEDDYIPDAVVSPTEPLWVDEGRPLSRYGRVADPAADAAAAFASALAQAGVDVDGPAAPGRAPRAADPVASVDSAPLEQVVQRIVEVSDNEATEVLLRHVGLAVSDTGSIEAGRAGVESTLQQAGVPLGDSVFHDGSGLSRANRTTPATLMAVLQLASSPEHPELRPLVAGLPVAGFTGSLDDRMGEGPPAGLGRVRAKTGTLSHVRTLAGLATDVDGDVMVFALMADRIKLGLTELEARDALDAGAAALGACDCAG